MSNNHYSDSVEAAQHEAIAIVVDDRRKLVSMAAGRNKSLSPEQNEHIRAVLDEILKRDFPKGNEGNLTEASKKLKVAQSLLSQVMNRDKGAGPHLILAIADYTGYSTDFIYGRTKYRYPADRLLRSGSDTEERLIEIIPAARFKGVGAAQDGGKEAVLEQAVINALQKKTGEFLAVDVRLAVQTLIVSDHIEGDDILKMARDILEAAREERLDEGQCTPLTVLVRLNRKLRAQKSKTNEQEAQRVLDDINHRRGKKGR